MIGSWLKRFAWLAAWSVWLAFGYALYVVVPRTPGRVIRFLELNEDETLIGFIDSKTFASLDQAASVVRIRDARTETVLETWPVGLNLLPIRGTCSLSDRLALLAIPASVKSSNRPRPAAVVNLRTGEETQLESFPDTAEDPGVPCCFHPDKSWILRTGWLKRDIGRTYYQDGRRPRVVVHDARTGRLVCSLPSASSDFNETDDYIRPHFVPGTDLVALDHRKWIRGKESLGSWKHTLELWRVPFGAAPERSFPGVVLGEEPDFSLNERVSWTARTTDGPLVEVFDLRAGRLLLSCPPRASTRRPDELVLQAGSRLSIDGSTLVDPVNGRIVDIDTGRTLWTYDSGRGGWPILHKDRNLLEFSVAFDDFLVDSAQGRWIASHLPEALRLQSFVVFRDLRTGFVQFISEETIQGTSPDSRLQLLDDDIPSIREYPHCVRWGLLAAIQCVLASPMFGILAFGHWKRRRRRAAS